MNKYFKNYILSVINIVASLVFPIITFPYVSRIIGPEKLGIIDFAQSYGYYFTHIASFGINSYAIREVSRVRDNEDEVNKVSNELFNLNFFFSVISTMLYFAGVVFVNNFRENFLVFAIYSIVIFTNFLSLEWLLQSFDDYLFSTVRNLFIRVLSVVLVFFLIKNESHYIIYLIITCISQMGIKLSSLMYCKRNYANLILNTKYLNFKKHIKSMFTLFTFRIINGISGNLDKLVIGFMLTYASVNIYSTGVKFIAMLQPVVETSGIILFPKINISANSSEKEYLENLDINYSLILMMGIPMAVGMFLISPRLIMLFAGDKYVDAIAVSRIMSLVLLFGPIGDMLGSKTLLVHKKDKELLICSLIVAVSNVLLNMSLIHAFGIKGAAIATLLTCLVSVFSRYYFTRKIIPFRFINKNFIKYLLYTVPFFVIYFFFKNSIDNINSSMFLFVGLCVVIYGFELLIFKDQLVRKMLTKMFGNKI